MCDHAVRAIESCWQYFRWDGGRVRVCFLACRDIEFLGEHFRFAFGFLFDFIFFEYFVFHWILFALWTQFVKQAMELLMARSMGITRSNAWCNVLEESDFS